MNLSRGQKVKCQVTSPINAVTDNAPYAGRSIKIFLKLACLVRGSLERKGSDVALGTRTRSGRNDIMQVTTEHDLSLILEHFHAVCAHATASNGRALWNISAQ